MSPQRFPEQIAPVEPPAAQFDAPLVPFLVEVDEFIRASQARSRFRVSGKGTCAAVLDTGVNSQHVDFAGRIAAQRNFTPDNNGNVGDATDGNGHGTNCSGIVLANGDHTGIAPDAKLAAVKVLQNNGGGSFQSIDQALEWIYQNRRRLGVTVVSMSLGDGGNYTDDSAYAADAIAGTIHKLKQERIPVVVAAGNSYYGHGSKQGMGYPAILRETISVGAVYDAEEGGFTYGDGAKANSTRAGQITPFSQRLHQTVNRVTRTEIFAPGAPVTSSGINGPHGESIQHGTSQATPVTTGVILLMQEFYKGWGKNSVLPTVDQIVAWLRRGGVSIKDGDDEDDNVQHTNLNFLRIDAVRALTAVLREVIRERLGINP